jgi:hypothetical protein
MASPINITPTLKNQASVKFNQQLEAQKNEKVSQADKARIATLVEKILAKTKSTK